MKSGVYSAEPIFSHQRIAVAPSWHCDARCLHCFLPEDLRDRDGFDPRVVDMFLDGLPEHVRVIGFTGGEPFLHLDRFFRLLEKVSGAGRVSTVITNALWSQDWSRAAGILKKAHALGLRGISISMDEYHRPSLPLPAVVRLLGCARELGLAVGLQGVGKRARQAISRAMQSSDLPKDAGAEGLVNLERVGAGEALKHSDIPSRELDSCMNAMDPLVTPGGKLYSCCSARLFQISNPILLRGSVMQRSAAELLDAASRDYLLAAVVVLGPGGLARLLGIEPNQGATRCEVCLGLLEDRAVLQELLQRIQGDLNLRKEIVGRHMLLEKCYLSDLYSQLQSKSKGSA